MARAISARVRIASTTLIAFAASTTAGCHRGPRTLAFTDGCYYVRKQVVFKVAGGEGTMRVPGPIRHFRVRPVGWFTTKAEFTPPFLFDGDIITVPFDDGVQSFAFPMVAGTQTPTIHMNLAAYGELDVARGPDC